MRDSFVFYRSFYEAIKNLDGKIQGEIYTAIMEYSLYGNEIELGPVAKAMFTLIKPQIDTNNKKYEAGKKGGRPSGENKPENNQEETSAKPSDNQEETKDEPNVYVNVNDNVNDNDLNTSPNGDYESEESDTPIDSKLRINYQEILNLYHNTCKSIPRVEKLSDSRKNQIRIRIAEFKKAYPDAGYMAVLYRIFLKIESSSFCKGDNKDGWRASFDWIFKNDKNWIKIIEGNYDNEPSRTRSSEDAPRYGEY